MSNFLKRILSGVVYVVIFITAILFSEVSYYALMVLFAVGCIVEFSKLIKYKNIISYALLPIFIYFFVQGFSEKLILFLLVITLLSSLRLIINLYRKESNYPKIKIEKLDATIRYIIFPFYFLVLLPFIDNEYTPFIIIAILILIWVSDSFAFLVGKNLGKTKLFESISPKKTIEGFVGGFLFSVIASYIIAINTSLFSITDWIIIGVIVSVFGMFGDLVESKFKRQANVKDSGKIMPGHGGLLDRLDSVLFVAPFVYLYIHYII